MFQFSRHLTVLLALGMSVLGNEAGLDWTLLYPARDRATITGFASSPSALVAVGQGGAIRCQMDYNTWATVESGITTDLTATAWSGSCFVAVGYAGVILRSTDGLHWSSQASFTSNNMYDVAWGNGQFVAVGGDATIRTSPDGLIWTSRASGGTSGYFTGVSFAGGKWVAVGWGVTTSTTPVSVSVDGINWTRSATGLTVNLNGVVPYQGKFLTYFGNSVLCSTDGATWSTLTSSAPALNDLTIFGGKLLGSTTGGVVSSEDGITWQTNASGLSPGPRCIIANTKGGWIGALGGVIGFSKDTFNWDLPGAGNPSAVNKLLRRGEKWIAVGESIALSKDDGGWGFAPKPTGYPLRSIAASPSTLIAVGDGGSVLKSSDGEAWSLKPSGTTTALTDVTWDGTRWLALGSYPYLYVSADDGETWSPSAMQPSRYMNGIASGGGRTVAISSSNGSGFVSSDGQAWQQVQISHEGLNDVAYEAGHFVAVGKSGTIRVSSDGLVWADAESPVSTEWKMVEAHPGRGFVAAGGGVIASSPDGLAWSLGRATSDSDWTALAGSAEGWMIIGAGAGGEQAVSDDGTVWRSEWSGASPVQQSVAVSGDRIVGVGPSNNGDLPIILVGYSPGLWTSIVLSSTPGPLVSVCRSETEFIATGSDGRIWWSADGEDWNFSQSGSEASLTRSAGKNREIVTVGNRGKIYHTVDRITWTEPSSGTTSKLVAVAVGPPGWVVGGDSGSMLFSTDGESWTPVNGGPSDTVHDIIWANQAFHAVGSLNGTYSSTNGMDWTAHPVVHAANPLNAIAWSGNRFVAVGPENGYMTSTDGENWEIRKMSIGGTRCLAWTGSSFISAGELGMCVSDDDSESWAGGQPVWTSTIHGVNGGIARFIGGSPEELPSRMPRISVRGGRGVLEFERAADSPDQSFVAVQVSENLVDWKTICWKTGDGRWSGPAKVREQAGTEGGIHVEITSDAVSFWERQFHRIRGTNLEP